MRAAGDLGRHATNGGGRWCVVPSATPPAATVRRPPTLPKGPAGRPCRCPALGLIAGARCSHHDALIPPLGAWGDLWPSRCRGRPRRRLAGLGRRRAGIARRLKPAAAAAAAAAEPTGRAAGAVKPRRHAGWAPRWPAKGDEHWSCDRKAGVAAGGRQREHVSRAASGSGSTRRPTPRAGSPWSLVPAASRARSSHVLSRRRSYRLRRRGEERAQDRAPPSWWPAPGWPAGDAWGAHGARRPPRPRVVRPWLHGRGRSRPRRP